MMLDIERSLVSYQVITKNTFYQYTQYYKKPKLVRPSLIWVGSKE